MIWLLRSWICVCEGKKLKIQILGLGMELLPVLVRMQQEGITLDRGKLQDIGNRLDEAIRNIETEVRELV